MRPILLHCVEVNGRQVDAILADGNIVAVGKELPSLSVSDAWLVEGKGHALLPGLHDHHIHLNASAAAFQSVKCGPPTILKTQELIAALHGAAGSDWLRGTGYHDSVAGKIDRAWLDRHGPHRPIRIQHRSGRLWIINSAALVRLKLDAPSDGRIFDGDGWLRERIGIRRPDPAPVGSYLASRGVTGLTEATPHNSLEDYRHLATAKLPQHLIVMGSSELDEAPPMERAVRGAVKLHHHDHNLPALDDLVAEVAHAHEAGRPVASHCTTTAELMLTLAAIEEAGMMAGDRIEHGSVVTPSYADWIARLRLTVVSQPHFLYERGEAYRREVAPADLPFLYRLAGLKRAGIAIAAGSDAPFGSLDPWQAMAAAVDRPAGFGDDEALDPEEALALFIGYANAPAVARTIAPGMPADLCLIDRPWAEARRNLAAVGVRITFVAGEPIYGKVEIKSPSFKEQ